MINQLRRTLRSDLESPVEARSFGSGWISGVGALALSVVASGVILSAHFPDLLATQQFRTLYDRSWFDLLTQGIMLSSFLLACISLVLRQNRILGISAIVLVFMASLIGSMPATRDSTASTAIISLDWFVLNLLMTGIVFIPLETFFGRLRDQPLFRSEWREDLLYFLISSLLVQTLTYLSLWPSNTIVAHTDWSAFRHAVGSQPVWLQFIEIMLLTDFIQYWFHRAFHRIPWLWRFHAVHHSAQKMDWLAGSRMHIVEIIGLRSVTVIPMMTFGYQEIAIQAYLLLVYLYSTYIHANIRFNVEWLKPFIVTPRFHHWHHGIEEEAIDINFAIHFPLFDRLFGTYYMPSHEWPGGYGIKGHPVPNGYLRQMAYPFQKSQR